MNWFWRRRERRQEAMRKMSKYDRFFFRFTLFIFDFYIILVAFCLVAALWDIRFLYAFLGSLLVGACVLALFSPMTEKDYLAMIWWDRRKK